MRGKVRRRGIHMLSAARRSKKKFRVGEPVPTSGLYQVLHSIHRVSHEVTLVHYEAFPPCTMCGDHIDFELLREIPEIDSDYNFRIRLFQIPHPAVKAEAAKKTA